MRAARKEGDLAAVATRLAEILQLDPGDADAIADLDEVQAQIKRVGAQRQVELAKAKAAGPRPVSCDRRRGAAQETGRGRSLTGRKCWRWRPTTQRLRAGWQPHKPGWQRQIASSRPRRGTLRRARWTTQASSMRR